MDIGHQLIENIIWILLKCCQQVRESSLYIRLSLKLDIDEAKFLYITNNCHKTIRSFERLDMKNIIKHNLIFSLKNNNNLIQLSSQFR